MLDSDHARYIHLLTSLWTGSTLSPSECDELNHLHVDNCKRVNAITTEGAKV